MSALAYDADLEATMQGHCQHMAQHPFFDRVMPESAAADLSEQAELCGTSATGATLALSDETAAQIMSSWQEFPETNRQMLDPTFVRVGIGHYDYHWGQLLD